MIDIAKARAETRGCEEVLHFNNAGSSLMPTIVSDALYDYLRQEEMGGGYETAAQEAEALENFYIATGKLLNCSPSEVAFIENATRAWDMAFYSMRFMPGDKILTTISEYGSNVIAYLQQAERYGVELHFVPDDENGQIDTTALANMIDDKVKLISISHIPTGGGLVNPAEKVGKIARQAQIPYLLDSCQGVGHIPLDVEALGCDMLSGTGRKYLRGPRGTGLLYVRQSFLEQLDPIMLDQHAATLTSPTSYTIRDDARRFENWERFFAGQATLGVAIDYALDWGIDNIQSRIYQLADKLRSRLAQIDGITITDQGAEKCGIVTFKAAHMEALDIKQSLASDKINVSVSSGSGSLVSFQQRDISSVVRASVHYFNTATEIDRFIDRLTATLARA